MPVERAKILHVYKKTVLMIRANHKSQIQRIPRNILKYYFYQVCIRYNV